MAITAHDQPQVLNAYSTASLTQSIINTTQHSFYDDTSARFGSPEVVVAIHNRTEFHGISHYDLRGALDAVGALSPFVVLDDTTPELDAVCYFRIVSLLGALEATTIQHHLRHRKYRYLKDLLLQEAKRDREDHKREL
ncbi:MAG: hypothetical protein Q9199_006290 [Rusavskia elegans]